MNVITVQRKFFTDKTTVGLLSIGGLSVCDTLEPTCRADGVKVLGSTAIPAGTYPLTINFSNRFQRLMPRLLNVPNFDGILIHYGNDAASTAGCLLVGHYDPATPDWVSDSRANFDVVFDRLSKLAEFGPMTITITGGRPLEDEAVA